MSGRGDGKNWLKRMYSSLFKPKSQTNASPSESTLAVVSEYSQKFAEIIEDERISAVKKGATFSGLGSGISMLSLGQFKGSLLFDSKLPSNSKASMEEGSEAYSSRLYQKGPLIEFDNLASLSRTKKSVDRKEQNGPLIQLTENSIIRKGSLLDNSNSLPPPLPNRNSSSSRRRRPTSRAGSQSALSRRTSITRYYLASGQDVSIQQKEIPASPRTRYTRSQDTISYKRSSTLRYSISNDGLN